jgi:hypothetical protein
MLQAAAKIQKANIFFIEAILQLTMYLSIGFDLIKTHTVPESSGFSLKT